MTELRDKLGVIAWDQYETAYGSARAVPDQLVQLFSEDLLVAMKASHHLWCGLCHQHAYISSAALPAFPFLMERLRHSPPDLMVEILDILVGFAICSRVNTSAWVAELRSLLCQEEHYFSSLTKAKDEQIHDFALWIIEELTHPIERVDSAASRSEDGNRKL